MEAYEDFTGLNLQEGVEQFSSLLAFENRSDLRVPLYEFDDTIEPAQNLLNLFNALLQGYSLISGSKQPYEHEFWLPADELKPALVIKSSFSGISLTDLAKRHQLLESYRQLKQRKAELESRVGPTEAEIESLKFRMDAIVSDSGHYQADKPGLDLNGIRGVETHEILLPPPAANQTERPELFLRVSHAYYLPEERQRFDLPEWQGLYFPNRFIRYPFLGEPEKETTYVWFNGERLDPAASDYTQAMATALSETTELLSGRR